MHESLDELELTGDDVRATSAAVFHVEVEVFAWLFLVPLHEMTR